MEEIATTRKEEEKTLDEKCLSPETWKDLLSICGNARKAISDFIKTYGSKETDDEKNDKFSDFYEKIKEIQEKYGSILEASTEKNSTGEILTGKDKQKINDVQDFFEKLGNALRDVIGKIKKGENERIDNFIRKMFEVSNNFYEIVVGINEKIKFLNSPSGTGNLNNDYDNHNNYADIVRRKQQQENLNQIKELIKQISIKAYKPLLELVCKEFERLLRDSGNNEPILKEKYEELKQELYIMEYLNIESYKDFREWWNILKNKQEESDRIKKEIKSGDFEHIKDLEEKLLHIARREKICKTIKEELLNRIERDLENIKKGDYQKLVEDIEGDFESLINTIGRIRRKIKEALKGKVLVF